MRSAAAVGMLALGAWLASARAQPAHDEHATHSAAAAPAPALTPEEREAAFPDLGDMGHIHIEDPLNRAVLLDRFESQDADGNPVAWDLDAWIGRDLTKVWIRSDGAR